MLTPGFELLAAMVGGSAAGDHRGRHHRAVLGARGGGAYRGLEWVIRLHSELTASVTVFWLAIILVNVFGTLGCALTPPRTI